MRKFLASELIVTIANMVQLKKKVTLKTKIADSDVKQDLQPKNTAPQEPINNTGGGNKA